MTEGIPVPLSKDGEAGGLKVLIAGAGIGGLVAAIALRQQGHEVELYEQSRLLSETGAAIHLAPNCNGLLRRIGVDLAAIGATLMRGNDFYRGDGKHTKFLNLEGPVTDFWQHPWELVHRQSLHTALKKLATEQPGKGKPAVLFTSSRTVHVDPHAATITLENGKVVQGDVVIGADGVHSVTRKTLPGGDKEPFDSGNSAFRFLIERDILSIDPITEPLVKNSGRMVMWQGEDRRIVMYPCNDNRLMNLVAIHPSVESGALGADWGQGGSKDLLLTLFKSFGPQVQRLFSYADPKGVRVWKLLDMERLPTMVNDRFAVLGDAAHPFLPYQGQGGAQAMEDAVALAAVLPFDTPRSDIADRLKLYEECRYERAHKMQHFTQLAGRHPKDLKASSEKLDGLEFAAYNFSHDAWDYANGKLRLWQAEKSGNGTWCMPKSFGPAPGPKPYFADRSQPKDASSFLTTLIKFKSSRTFLETLFPSKSFTFVAPGTVAYATVLHTTKSDPNQIGRLKYSTFSLYFHDVKYTKKDGTSVTGTYMPLLFDSCPDPLFSGSNETGAPRFYCELESTQSQDDADVRISWQKTTFGTMNLRGLEMVTAIDANNTTDGQCASSLPSDEGVLAFRHIPTVGQSVGVDAEYTVFTAPTTGYTRPIPQTVRKAKDASLSFKETSWDELPTLHSIATILADIPVYRIVDARVIEGIGPSETPQAMRID